MKKYLAINADNTNNKVTFGIQDYSEANALNNYDGPKSKLKNATIYVTLFPCNECAKRIVESGIKRIIYKSDKYKDTKDNKLSKLLLDACNIEYTQLEKIKEKQKAL